MPGGWRLRGTKHYISGADIADAAIVVARTGTDAATGRGRLSLFLVPMDSPGIERTLIPVDVLTPERQFTVFFDDVVLGEDSLIGTEGDGLRQVFHGLNPERILSAAVCCGLGRYALESASAYATTREVWGVPIGSHQGIAHPLAEAAIGLELAITMTRQAAARFDAGLDAAVAANCAKFAAAEAVARCVDQAIQVHGGNGLAQEYGLSDVWGLARLYRIAPVSQEMVLNFVAQRVLGLPRSY